MTPQRLDAVPMDAQDIVDIVAYVTDTSVTLYWFSEIYPPVSSVFLNGLFTTNVANFCETVIPTLKEEVKKVQVLTFV